MNAVQARLLGMHTDQRLALAKERHLAGDLAAARSLYEAVLADEPAHDDALFRLAVLDLQEGRYEASLARLDRAVKLAPHHARYRFARAQVLAALSRFDEAIEMYRTLLAPDTVSADVWFALALAFEAKGDLRQAIAAYESAVALEPAQVDALNNLGNCHRRLGNTGAAEAAYRRVLEMQPENAHALTNLGTLAQAAGRGAEAIDLLYDAIGAAPDSPVCLLNLGVALSEQRHFEEAVVMLERVLELDPQFPQAAYNLGNTFHATGQYREAQLQYRNALALDARHADALNNLGNVCKALGEYKAAAEAFEAAIAARPGFVDAYSNAGNLMRSLHRMDEAAGYFRAALSFDPAHSASYNNLGNVMKDIGALDECVDCYRRAVACDPHNVVAHSNLVYALSFQTDDPAAVLDEARRWAAQHEAPLRAARVPHVRGQGEAASAQRLKIGYVSPDFREHCQALFLMPLLSHHDRAAFEIVCYSTVERPDDTTRQLASHADVWKEVHALDDRQLADAIRADGIDILVDLTMHMADGRPLTFARKPAPVQAAWLAYPGTTGLGAIDYRLTDPRLDPPSNDTFYSERTLRLPDSFWCYDPLTDTPAVDALPATRNGYLTFGCLNNTCKLTDRTFALWSPVLRALPEARLVLLAPEGEARIRLARRLDAQGIAAERVTFMPFRPRENYLHTYHHIDIGLDAVPYNGHTTSLDSYWMGVPVVTRVGTTAVARGGLSQLHNLGLIELAADSDDAFVRIAVQLASDLPALATLRASLRERMQRSPLMDGARFARNVEAAYRQMWREWCAGS